MFIYDKLIVIAWNATQVGHSSGSNGKSTSQSE